MFCKFYFHRIHTPWNTQEKFFICYVITTAGHRRGGGCRGDQDAAETALPLRADQHDRPPRRQHRPHRRLRPRETLLQIQGMSMHCFH